MTAVQSGGDDLTITVGGRAYNGWENVGVTRALTQLCSDFSVDVSERWLGQPVPWRIRPFQPLTVAIGADAVLTGYVEQYVPELSAKTHKVGVRGRSKTGDLVECMPDLSGSQFRGYGLAPIARAICQPFGIEVVDQIGGEIPALANCVMTRGETAFAFLDRLARLASVLLTDDERGRLVLTRAGVTMADDTLRQGDNILSVAGAFDVSKRFSVYTVKGQTGLGGGIGAARVADSYQGFGDGAPSDPRSGATSRDATSGGAAAGPPAPLAARISAEATATDAEVPRYRPHVTIAESGLDLAGMRLRAAWQAASAAGKSLTVRVTVRGWRQSSGRLWRPNEQANVDVPFLDLQAALLIVRVRYVLAPVSGQTTEIELAPASGYTPDPGSVKVRKARRGAGKSAEGPNYAGWGGH